jgi:hypothetical protein
VAIFIAEVNINFVKVVLDDGHLSGTTITRRLKRHFHTLRSRSAKTKKQNAKTKTFESSRRAGLLIFDFWYLVFEISAWRERSAQTRPCTQVRV